MSNSNSIQMTLRFLFEPSPDAEAS